MNFVFHPSLIYSSVCLTHIKLLSHFETSTVILYLHGTKAISFPSGDYTSQTCWNSSYEWNCGDHLMHTHAHFVNAYYGVPKSVVSPPYSWLET